MNLLLAFPEHEKIENVGYRLSIIRARSAAVYERIFLTALCRKHRHLGKLKHIDDIRIRELILESETENIKMRYLVAGFQRKKSHAMLFHLLLHIVPRSKDSFTPCIVTVIQGVIDYFHTEM